MRQLLENDLWWLAGLLEGEGYFGLMKKVLNEQIYLHPRIALTMTDGDVVARAASTIGHQRPLYIKTIPSGKMAYTLSIHGEDAIALMEQLLPLMGSRRYIQIRKSLDDWAEYKAQYFSRSKTISLEELGL